jgi:diguanylate cyclase (GGDEF)-like protein
VDAGPAPSDLPPQDGWPADDRHADDLAAIHRVATLGPGDPDVRLRQWLTVGRDLLGAQQALILLGVASPFDVEAAVGANVAEHGSVVDHRVDLALREQATVASLGGRADAADDPHGLGRGTVVASPLWVSGERSGAVVLVAPPDRSPFAAWTLSLLDLVADGIARVLEHRAEGTARSAAAAEQAAFEAVVASISTRLIGSSAADLDLAIVDGLRAIASFFAADVAFIDEVAADRGSRRRRHEWVAPWTVPAPGVAPAPAPAPSEPPHLRAVLARLARAGHLVVRRGRGQLLDDTAAVMLGDRDRAALWVRLGTGTDPAGVLGLAWQTSDPPDTDDVLGPVRFAADAFHGAVRRRRAAVLALDQAAVFESIARNEPVMTSLSLVQQLLEQNAAAAEVAILTIGPTGFTLVGEDPRSRRSTWYAARSLDLSNPYGQAVVTGVPVEVAAVATDPRFRRSAAPDDRFRSLSVTPVRSSAHGHTVAVIALLGADPSSTALHPAVRAAAESLIVVAIDRDHDLRRLAHQATHDPLTDVGNRAALLDRLDLALARARRTDRRVAVLFCDLDGFKAVNDRYGHDVGDRMLVEVAGRICGAVRPSDTVARTGGDEFVVVCEDLQDPSQAQAIADRITGAVEGPSVRVGELDLRVAVSIGIALADAVTDNPDRLLHAADLAMYRAKDERRGRAPDADQ